MTAALRAVWTNKTLWAIHVIANAALLVAMYGWLSIPDRTVLDLILSAIVAVSIVLLASWLHAGTLEFFRLNRDLAEASVRASLRPSIRRIGIFALWLLVLCAAVVLVLQLRGHLDPPSNWIASALTFRLRRPVRPAWISAILSFLVGVVAFIVVPMALLQFWKRKWSWKYFLIYIALFIVGAYLPYRLIWWVPKLSGIYGQAASMAVRFSVAYLLAVTAWLLLAAMTVPLPKKEEGAPSLGSGM
jgi:hypothetical protein